MNFLEALQYVVAANINAADVPVLEVNGATAANILSEYINMEGGLGYVYGPFKNSDGTTTYELDLRETAESPNEELGADDNICSE